MQVYNWNTACPAPLLRLIAFDSLFRVAENNTSFWGHFILPGEKPLTYQRQGRRRRWLRRHALVPSPPTKIGGTQTGLQMREETSGTWLKWTGEGLRETLTAHARGKHGKARPPHPHHHPKSALASRLHLSTIHLRIPMASCDVKDCLASP
jgi:hypothetical protein